MAKVFILIGKSGSGKSTIESKIEKMGYCKRLISSTTRDKRTNEIDGVDYNFISEEEFNKCLDEELFAEHSSYTTVNGQANYGIRMKDIDATKNSVCVLNPHGASQMVRKLGKDKCVTIYIQRDDRERVISALIRDNSDFESVFKEAYRRYEADKLDFWHAEEESNYVVYNKDLSMTIHKIVKIIELEGR